MTTQELRTSVSKTTEGIAAGLMGENGIDTIMQTFATFLEELELPGKLKQRKYHDGTFVYMPTVVQTHNGTVDKCRQAITKAANELKGQDDG